MSAPLAIKSVLVAVDGSENSDKAATAAIEVAKRVGADLWILTVIPIPVMSPDGSSAVGLSGYFKSMQQDSKKLLADLTARAQQSGVNANTRVIDNVTSTVFGITKFAEDNKVDLLVVGSRGLGGFKKLLLGSVSTGILNHAHCSVLVVR